uniref:G-protein coupled receptors family 1 profile domain-containing protein n=2 Tax=Ciona intestinalis TaxID=7719 RepID=F6RJ37_CIOIN
MEFNISNTTIFPSLEESALKDNVVRAAYRAVSLLFIVADFYLVAALLTYELTLNKNKARGGRPLRALCILAATISLLHQILQQFLLMEYSGKSDTACMVNMCLKSTVFNLQVTTTYVFLWKRQRMSYANPALRHLRTKFMEVLTWVVMVLLLVNPFIMLGFQFKGKLYEVQRNKCVVLKQPTVEQIPYIAVAFSYSFIEITLIYLYLNPLYKNRSNRLSDVSKNAAC